MKSVFVLAALAAISFTGAALAQDVSKGWSTTTAAVPKAMSDAEMDKVTAGEAGTIYTPGDAQMNGLPNSPFVGAYGGLVYPGHSSVCVNDCFFRNSR
jgi:hypothetical protein